MKKIKYKKQIHHTFHLNELFDKGENPELIIKFIYKNLYQLINEIKYIPNEFHDELNSNYRRYYVLVIEQSNQNWLFTLFPNPYLNRYDIINWKKFYEGLAGRICFFSGKTAEKGFYWYGDPTNWVKSYFLYLYEDNTLTYRCCQFIVLNSYSDHQMMEALTSEQSGGYAFIINKKGIKFDYDTYAYDPQILIERLKYQSEAYYSFNEKEFLEWLAQYKSNVNKEYNKMFKKSEFKFVDEFRTIGYNPAIGELWSKIWSEAYRYPEKFILIKEKLDEKKLSESENIDLE